MNRENVPGSRYTAVVREVTPAGRIDVNHIGKAYSGVSVGHPYFRGRRLEAFATWAQGHVREWRLVIGERLLRWTIMIESGVSEEQAQRIATTSAERQHVELQRVLAKSCGPGGLVIIRDSDVHSHPRFESAYSDLVDLRYRDERFAALTAESARQFCERRLRRGKTIKVDLEVAIEYSTQFLLEEIAVFCALVTMGFPVEIYPGAELFVLQAISRGEIPNAPQELKARTNVVIEIKRTYGSEVA